jgi:hypothetical protein
MASKEILEELLDNLDSFIEISKDADAQCTVTLIPK